MEKKEKPLEKMTAKELRAIALEIPEIEGVHAMKKEELLEAIRKSRGVEKAEEKEAKK
jgi:cell division protein FtsX